MSGAKLGSTMKPCHAVALRRTIVESRCRHYIFRKEEILPADRVKDGFPRDVVIMGVSADEFEGQS